MKFCYPFLVVYFALAVQTGLAQKTYVPDNNFEQALIDLNYDDTLDDSVLTENISGVTNLNVEGKEISDLTGIEGFTALTYLYCENNQLTSLDVSANTALEYLKCNDNQLTSLDVSSNTALTNLECYTNQLTSLDVSSNTALTYLSCNTNQLTSLDVSSNTALTSLHCSNNQFTTLDVSNNTALTSLNCNNLQLTTLDVSNNTALSHMWCYQNLFTSLDVSNNTALTLLNCEQNLLTSLNVSANTALMELDLESNQLTSLDVSNNTALTELRCGLNQLTSLDVSNNTALTDLDCRENQLTSLDVSSNTSLTYLNLTGNQLTSLDVSANTALTSLSVGAENQLTSLDVSNNTALTSLAITNQQLTSLDLSNNTALTFFDCNSSNLNFNLDLSANTALTMLNCPGNQFTALDLSANTALDNLICRNNQLTSLDLSNNTLLTHLECNTNQLTSLDVSSNTALTELLCNNNQLTSLDVSSNTALGLLGCQDNQLTNLDVSNNTVLTELVCGSNPLTALDVSSNTALTLLRCNSNQLTSLDVSSNTALGLLGCQDNQLTNLDVSNNTVLRSLHIDGNQLTYFNMKNGVTDGLEYFTASNNSLTCIETLDPAYATANWTSANNNIDAGVTFDVICGAAARTNWHVASTGSDITGSGTLASPLSSIQTAINAATVGDTVSVAAGNYVENINFSGKNIAVIGADSSNTIIDGDSSGSVVSFNSGEDTTAVLKNFTITNGNANTGNYPNNAGAGVLIYNYSSPTLRNLIVTNNYASHGGGGIEINTHCNPLLDNITINQNSASRGAGLSVQERSNPEIKNTIISNNQIDNTGSGLWGGGVCIESHSNPTFENVQITGNTATRGGGVYISNQSNPTFENVQITSNTANGSGGGIYVENSSSPVFSGNVSLLSNHANQEGGGFMVNGSGNYILSNIIIANNTAGNRGAGIVAPNSYFLIQNSTIINNHASGEGGGALFLSHNSNTNIVNSICWGNSPQEIWFDPNPGNDPSQLSINYSDIQNGQTGIITNGKGTVEWGTGNITTNPLFADTANGNFTLQAGSPSIDAGHPNAFYNDTNGTRNDMGYSGGNGITLSATKFNFGYLGVGDSRNKTLTVTNNRDAAISISGATFDDSQFSTSTSFPVTVAAYSAADVTLTFTPSTTGAHADTLQLSSNDIPGSNTYGEFALSGNGFDLSDGVVQVPGEVPTIQGAIDATSNGDTVQVAAGTYFENINFNGKNIVVIGADSSTTIIDGDSSGSVVMFGNGEDTTAVLKNFTIKNGYANGGGWPYNQGGGILLWSNSSPTLENLIIKENTSDDHGGGISAQDGCSPIISNVVINNNISSGRAGGLYLHNNCHAKLFNVTITNNVSSLDGGGIYARDNSEPIIKNSIISNNTSSDDGGGIYINDGTLTIYSSDISNNTSGDQGGGIGSIGGKFYVFNSTISGNSATGSGGGVSSVGGNLMMNNVQITANTSTNTGGGLYLQTAASVLNNITVADNTANYGGGLYVCCDHTVDIENSVFYNNSPQELEYSNSDGWPNVINVSYSIIEGGQNAVVMYSNDSLYWGLGSSDNNPLFNDAANGDYTLQANSPAINAGNPNGFYNDSDGSRNDMGYSGGNGLIVSTFNVVLIPSNNIPRITPLEIDFGSVGIGNNAPTENFYIYNTRTDSVILGSYSTTDNQFTVTSPVLPVTIQSFENRSLNVQFLATSSGDQTSTIELSFSNLSNNNGSFSAVGTAYDIPAGNINVPADVPTIQTAIDIAPNGKTIVVAPGEYFENINFTYQKDNILLKSSQGPLVTIINGANSSAERLVQVRGNNLTLDGFTIKNGSGDAGIYAYHAHYPVFKNLILENNLNYCIPGNATVENSIFRNNTGELLVIRSSTEPYGCVFKNVTIAGNNDFRFRIQHQAPANPIDDYTDVFFFNSVFWDYDDDNDNEGFVIHWQGAESSGSPRLYIENSLLSFTEADITNPHPTAEITWGSNNLTSYPYFNDPDNGDYSLSSYSPMIGAGATSHTINDSTYYAPNTDILGNARPNPVGTSPDIGAYESSESVADYNPHKYVTITGNNSGPGTLDQPFLTIQYAIDQAQNDDIIHVAAGTYVENINYNGKNISLIGEDRQTTIIDGNNTGRVVIMGQFSSLSNFTIQNGTGSMNARGSGINAPGNVILNNLIVKNNTNSTGEGAGIFFDSSPNEIPVLKNSLIIGNTGDGITCHGGNPLIDNVTIINNSLGIYLRPNVSGAHPTVINSIIYGNSDNNQIIMSSGGNAYLSAIDISYCLVQGGQSSISQVLNDTINWGSGNIDVDPMFVDTTNGNYHLLATSQLINAGHPDSTDSDGTRADIGAYPFLNTYSGPTWYVSATDGNNTTATGASAAPFKSIQSAINFATDADSVTVAAGTYVENIDFRGRNIKVVGADRETTIIDGNQSGSVVYINSSDSVSPLLKNFKITNGTGTLDAFDSGDDGHYGGGVLCIGGNPVLQNLFVVGNNGRGGAGIYTWCPTIEVKNCIIYNNDAGEGSISFGGIGFYSGIGLISNTLIYDNVGSGVYFSSGDKTTIMNSTIYNNSDYGVRVHESDLNIINTIFYDNEGTSNGHSDSTQVWGSGPTNINTTHSFFPFGQTSIVVDESAVLNWSGSNQGSYPSDNFIDPDNGDFHLSDFSVCISGGTPSTTFDDVTYTAPSTDLDGNPRPNPAGTVPDMGAYESDKGVDPNYAGPVWYVDGPAGLPYGNGGPGAPFTTIAAGISASSSGDTVSVKAGTYVENINYNGKNISVIGENRETTIIDGNQTNSVVIIENGEQNPMLKNLTLTNGNAESGGLWISGNTVNCKVENVSVIANTNTGIYIAGSSSAQMQNVLSANNSGEGIIIWSETNTVLSNFTSFGNTYGMRIQGDDLPKDIRIVNSIIYGNQNGSFLDYGSENDSLSVYYSNIEDGQSGLDTTTVIWGSGNIDVDPMFVDTANGNYHLLASSKLINAGHPDSTDSDGTVADIGAYPYLNSYSGPTWYISESGNDTTATGTSNDPFRSIQAALNFGNDDDTAYVSAGTYNENLVYRYDEIESVRNVSLIGEDRETTIIDGQNNGICIKLPANGYSSPLIKGFRIRNGYANGQMENGSFNQGGGVSVSHNYDPVSLHDLIIENCNAVSGGGIFSVTSSLDILNVNLNQNTAESGGGMYFSHESSVLITNTTISNNTADADGGGIRGQNSNITLTNCKISGNVATTGGGIYGEYGIIRNSEITNNSAGYAGAISGEFALINCTVANNASTSGDYSVEFSNNSTDKYIMNSIFYGNTPDSISVWTDMEISYSNVEGGLNVMMTQQPIWGSGNIDVNPIFVDTANGDYTLQMDSPLIDAGHPDSTDADGTRADIGAYYYDQSGQPARVLGFVTTPTDSNEIILTWDALSPEPDHYAIYRSTDMNANFYLLNPHISSVAGNAITIIDDNQLSEDITYHYRIRGIDSDGDEGLLALPKHGRLASDSTSLRLNNSYAAVENITFLPTGSPLTLEGFFKLIPSTNDEAYVIGFPTEIEIHQSGSNDSIQLRLYHWNTPTNETFIIDTSWHHIAFTSETNETKIWVDGFDAMSIPSVPSFSSFDIGPNSGTEETIIVDELKFSNIVRYNTGFIPINDVGMDENTIGYWQFNEGSLDANVPAAYDWSGNGLHMEIMGVDLSLSGYVGDAPQWTDTENALVINEIMQNPSEVSDPQGEWIEIHNRWFTPINLKDFSLADDGSDGHTITSVVFVPAGGYAVLASNADTATNAGLIANYEFSGFSLGNSNDEVLLSDPNGVEIDRVAYDNGTTFPDPSGASMELIAPHYDNSLGNSWTVAVTEYGAGDLGSPGRRNDAFSGAIVLSDSVFSFGGAVEGNELVNTLNISNTGVRPLTITTISSTLAEFTVSAGSAVVPIGDTLALVITFTPTGPGLYQDTLLIVSDDPVRPNTRVPLEAFGISEAADITIASAVSDSLATFGFPLTRIGSPRTTTFSVSNIGAEALEIDEITFTGDVNGFTVDQSSLYLELYDTVFVEVTFDPPVNGPYAATLGFSSNDPDEALYNIAFTGTGSQYIIFEVPNEITTIQAALDTALAGDTVNVAAGTYGGELVFPANDLVLRGSSQETTILNGGDSSVVLTVNSGQTSASIISGITIRGGLGTNGGGVVVDNGSSPVFDQIIFYDNGATQGAAIYVNSFSNPTISRSTFVVNSASSGQGGGIAVAGGSNVTVTSSIFWANTGTAVEVLSGSADITYSIVEGGDAGTGNLDQNPLFVNPGTGDFHIQWGSPAIDGGDPASPPDPDGTSADMGALYYDQTLQPPNAPTGLSFTAAADHVTLSWTANQEADLVSYIIYSGLSAETLDSLSLVLAPNTTYEDFTIDPAVPVYYQVAAVDTGSLMGNRSTVLEVSYPVIATSSESVDFGSVRFLQSVEQIIHFYNHGSLELNIDSIFVQADVGFSVSTGGLVLQTGTPAGSTSMLSITPLTPGRGTGDINQDKPLSLNPGKENAPEIHSRTREGFTINPGDSMEITITFTSADTGSFATNLVAQSDDPITNDLNVPLTAHAVAPGIELVRTMSVVSYLNNDITFDVAVQNPGGYPLDYTVTAEANHFGFEWLAISQGTGQVPGFTTGTLTVNVTNTANLDAAGYQGYLYFNTNASGNPDVMVPTDTIDVYMTLLADGSQISDGDVTVPSGNAPIINVVDDGGTDMGLMLDFINSSGGSITVTRIDAQPPVDASTAFTDPSGTITNPIYARRYYEINATVSGSFAVDIGFDYATLAGILDPATLRLAKRSLNAGTGEEWTIIPSASTTLNETDGLVVASNQTGFSQWTVLSNVGENTFIDMQAPAVASTSVNPTQPGILEDVTITATINDETGISTATLYYTSGGSAVFASTDMSGTGNSWSALIPGSEVSRNGIIYYISATDPLSYSALSDTFGVAVTFPSGDLTTSSVSNSGYSGGLPIDKWRLLAVPAVLTTATVAGVIGDELGAQSSATWRIFRYDQNTSTYKENPNNFTPGEAYWIYQRVEDNLVLTAPGGETGSMDGTSLTIVPGWNLISSPYPFLVDAALNQTLFYGPVTYGVSGESWTDVQTELIPWSGYALYNRTANNQTVTLDPIGSTSGTLARTVQKEGWLMNLAVSAGVYADQFNQLGRIIGAEDGLDYFDNPELLTPGEYLSLTFALPEYGGKTVFTSDLRSPGNDAAVWTANIRAKGLSETATLSWMQIQSFERNEAVRIIDRQNRTVVDPLSVSNLFLGHINERFPRVLDLVVGDPAQVEKLVKEILASLPEEFSLKQNYPNPFNPVTTIQFGLPQPSNVRLTIVNILGQEVTELVNDWRDIGFHQVRWAGVNDQGLPVSTGVYFSILTDGQQVQIRKMLLVK